MALGGPGSVGEMSIVGVDKLAATGVLRIGDFSLAPFVFSTHLDAALGVAYGFALGNEPLWFDPDPTLAALLTPAVSIALFLTIA